MKSRFSACLMVAIVALFLCSCDSKKDRTLQELKDVSRWQIKFPDAPLFRSTKSKILVLVADTGECSPCSMGVNEWYVYRLDMEERHLDADIVFVLPEGMRLSPTVDTLLLQYGLDRYYGYETFMKLNPVFKQIHYSTFLISPEHKVVLVGSPLDSPKLWRVYRSALREKE